MATQKNNNDSKKKCLRCQKDKLLKDYYASFSDIHADGKIPFCKQCLQEMILDDNGQINIDKLKDTLRKIDRPFLQSLWDISVEDENDTFGTYMKNLGMKQNRDLTWQNSDERKINNISNDIPKTNENPENYDIDMLKEKFGFGYPDVEYYMFEKKYQQLKPSIPIYTTMHDEFFREYCVDKVKETLAKARGDFKEAKEWAAMAKDAANAGKLQPNQMSKADLSSGLDTFGQLVRAVEQEVDIIPILPKFTERPKDKVDIVLWHFINYVRDLKGLPLCEYKEIYDFYNQRKEEYENQMLDNEIIQESENSEGDFDGEELSD